MQKFLVMIDFYLDQPNIVSIFKLNEQIKMKAKNLILMYSICWGFGAHLNTL